MPDNAAMLKRYQDAYRVARATVSIGDAIKTIGVILAIIFVIGGLLFTAKEQSLYPLVGSIAVGALGGFLMFVLGVLVAANGQTLMATLDSAVCVSPFLTNEDKSKVISGRTDAISEESSDIPILG